jgi:heptosyltransferase II
VVVSNDSAFTHMASLLAVPTATIFGPTIPEFGFAPLAPRSVVLQNNTLRCRPCTAHGSKQCPISTHECMTSITTGMVETQILSILQHETTH